MQNYARKMGTVNDLAQQLIRVEHPNSEQILARQDSLNNEWNELAGKLHCNHFRSAPIFPVIRL